MSSLANKREILQLIIRKKVSIENNYFTISSIIDEIIKTTDDNQIIQIAKGKQIALDNAINFAVSQLEVLIQNFINSLQSFDSQKHKEIEAQLKQTIDELNLKTQILTQDLTNAKSQQSDFEQQLAQKQQEFEQQQKQLLEQQSLQQPTNDSYVYGTFDNVPEKEVEKHFGKTSRNELKDLREGILIESFNQPSPRELSVFDDMYFDEVAEYNDYKESREELKKQIARHNEFTKMVDHSVNEQLVTIENRLMDEINKLKISNQLVSDTNDSLLSKIQREHPEIVDPPVNKQSFDMLDTAINDMISKIEFTKIPDYKEHDIKNLEDISQTLVKSLESNIENLSNDLSALKEENKTYRDKIDEYVSTINNLKNDRIEREKELNESYLAWVSSNRKLQDLENLLGQQSIDISDLDGQKNVIIDMLEKKLKDTIQNLNAILTQNEELLLRQEELEEFIRVNDIKNDYSTSAFDQEIEARSLQDLVEKEANKIVDVKFNALITRYKEELDELENKVKANIQGINSNTDILSYEFEKQQNHSNEIKDFQDKITKFENKIKILEEKLYLAQTQDRRNRETLENLNEILDYDKLKENVMDNEVSQKLKHLESLLNETMSRIDLVEQGESRNNKGQQQIFNPFTLSQEDVHRIVKGSDIYNDIRIEVLRLENQVNALKDENTKIKKENYDMTSELDDSFQKFAYNTSKMKQVEELLNSQVEEFEKLNNEKDELIAALETKMYDAIEANNAYNEQYTQYYDEQYQQQENYSEALDRENIELLIDKRVNELLADKALDALSNINKNNQVAQQEMAEEKKIVFEEEYNFMPPTDPYPSDLLSNYNQEFEEEKPKKVITKKVVKKEVQPSYDEYEDDLIPVEQSFESSGYSDKQPTKYVEEVEYIEEEIVEDQNVQQPSYVKEEQYQDYSSDDQENMVLKTKLINLQNEYNMLLKELDSNKNVREKIVIKEVDKQKNSVPKELLENTERLRNFERLLIQIDNEISNLENDSLNKFLDASQLI